MKYILFLCLLVGFSWTVSAQNGEDDEVILKAMKDEMQRSVEELALPGMPKPSFIAYTLWRYQQFEIVGTLGAITNSFVLPQIASGSVQVQLGTHEHNNDITYVNPATVVGMPAEADYDVIRRSFWQGTDKMYKMSLQELAIKEGLLKKNPLSPEEMSLKDVNPVPAVNKLCRNVPFHVDQRALENMVCRVSSVFKGYEELINSMVSVSGFSREIYKQTTDGVTTKVPMNYVALSIQAQTIMDDGVTLGDRMVITVGTPDELPSEEELKQKAITFADNLMALREAQRVEDEYNGPVMFEDDACSSLFMGNLLHKSGLLAFRKPLIGQGQNKSILNDRMNKQILDERISIKNCTSLKEYNGISLLGAYEIDAEGVVPPSELTLVENGILKAFLNGSIPCLNAPNSTGSSRYVINPVNFSFTTAPATIHVQVQDGEEREKMKKTLMKMAKKEGYDYAYIVRRMAGMASSVYQVDVKTGAETLMCYAQVMPVGLDKLKEIVEISSEEMVFNYVWNNQVLSSMICPRSVLLEDVKITKAAVKPEKAPILPSPLKRE